MNARAKEIASGLPPDSDVLPRLSEFRLRGIAMTRLETFIDAAFAFAITMLVIAAQQIPDDIETLLSRMSPRLWQASLCSEFFGAAIGCGAGGTVSKMARRSSLAGR